MTSTGRMASLAALMAGLVLLPPTNGQSAEPSAALATPQSFDAIPDTAVRSAALFTEAGKVLTSPRCVNCHPAGDSPLQGDAQRIHDPAPRWPPWARPWSRSGNTGGALSAR